MDNNPFFPPICIRSALSVTVNASSIGMDDSRGDLERALIGLLVMGAEVDLVFDLVVEAGQSMEMALIPPWVLGVFHLSKWNDPSIQNIP